MVLFAGFFVVCFVEIGVPLWISLILTIGVMIVLAVAIERLVLRHLVNQEGIILFMATIGVSFFLDGFGQTIWGSNVKQLDVGIPTDPIFLMDGDILIQRSEEHTSELQSLMRISYAVFRLK